MSALKNRLKDQSDSKQIKIFIYNCTKTITKLNEKYKKIKIKSIYDELYDVYSARICIVNKM